MFCITEKACAFFQKKDFTKVKSFFGMIRRIVNYNEAFCFCHEETDILKKAKSYDLAFFLAGALGIEPRTRGFGDRCSTG